MLFDMHMHTIPFSSDSGMVFSDLRAAYQEKDLGVIITEHVDYDFPPPLTFNFSPEAYFAAYEPFKKEHVLLGVETGMKLSIREKNHKLVSSYPFDMVIGSIHEVEHTDLYEPEYFALFEKDSLTGAPLPEEQQKKAAFTAYLTAMKENIAGNTDFDTLGHIDYISRTAPYSDPLLYDHEYHDLLEDILQLLIRQHQSLEINTRNFSNPAAVAALRDICLHYKALGGETVTIGSDAHKAEAVGAYLEEAYAFASDCRLTPVIYRKRTPVRLTDR